MGSGTKIRGFQSPPRDGFAFLPNIIAARRRSHRGVFMFGSDRDCAMSVFSKQFPPLKGGRSKRSVFSGLRGR